MSILSNWYYLERERLKDYDVLKIKKELIESPNSFGLTIADKENMVLYREDGKYFRVPRQYGLDTFGEPDERDLIKGWEIDVEFDGELDEDRKNQVSLTSEFLRKAEQTVGGILCSGPGTGKTVMSLYLLAQFKVHTLVLVNKEFIMQQWFDRIQQFLKGNFTVGKIQQDKCEYTEDIVVGMLQSFNARKYPDRMYKSFGLVVTDETHHISAPTFFDVTSRFNPEFMMGLTATPYRGDGLHGVFFKHIGPILAENRVMDVGGLVHQIGVTGRLDDRIFRNRAGKFNISRWISSIAKIKQRTAIIAKHAVKMKKSGRKVMVLTHRLNHVSEIIEQVKELGEEATKTVGGMNAEKVFKAFSDYDIVVGTYQFISEAVDIPELNGMILATPHSNIEQAIGRLTRTTVKKKRPIVTEIVDTWSNRARGYAQKHLRIYNRLGFEIAERK